MAALVPPAPVQVAPIETGDDAASLHSDEEAPSTTGDAEELVCKHCGAILAVNGDVPIDHCESDSSSDESEGTEPAPKPQPKKATKKKKRVPPKPRTSPKALKQPAVRVAARVQMLAAVPGITPTVARRVIRRWPTFSAVVAAGLDKIAHLRVGYTAYVNMDRAQAILWAIGEE